MMKDKLPANHLPAWRKRAGFTQAQIEKMLSWPHGRLSHLENGSAHLTQDVLDVLGPIYAKEASNLLEPPPAAPVYQSQPPRRRKKDSPTLADGVAMLQQLMDELEIMRVAHAEQLARLGKAGKASRHHDQRGDPRHRRDDRALAAGSRRPAPDGPPAFKKKQRE
jgi:transcriptional regulator with XRE-family HTH domain